MKKVTKAVIAAAGLGTRFLPQTKAMPKEMLPIVDKPIIQYVVEELVSVGVEEIIIVTGNSKRSIEDHFAEPNEELVAVLNNGDGSKKHLLEEVEAIADLAKFIYVRQKGPWGNGTPLLNVEHIIGDEPFFFTFSDEFIVAFPPRFQQMMDAYNKFDRSVLGVVRAKSEDDYDRYGFACGKSIGEGLIDVSSLIEKPGKGFSESTLATNGGFLFTPEVFAYLHEASDKLVPGHELYWNDAIKLMIADGKKVIALEISNGTYYDSGNKLEYLKTVVDFALQREDIKDDFRAYLKTLLS